jgi:hypothetical protein
LFWARLSYSARLLFGNAAVADIDGILHCDLKPTTSSAVRPNSAHGDSGPISTYSICINSDP